MDRTEFCGYSVSKTALRGLVPALFLFSLALFPGAVCPQTELGSEDDLTVLGSDGTAPDPDAEIKGFTVFGSTQSAYTGALVGPGNVVVNGVLAVSSGAYFVGNSTFTGAGKIFINDGSAGQLLRRNAAGYLEWAAASALGDNLGNHTATQALQMGAYGVNTSSDITAARYQINGSTVLSVLSGSNNIGVGVGAGTVNTGNNNTFVGKYSGTQNSAGGNNTFVGSLAGYSNTTGDNNAFFGVTAGYGNTSGVANAFFGSEAGMEHTTGVANTLVGYDAGYKNQTGSANAILGAQAGYGLTGHSFSSSTLMGYRAGYSLRNGSADNIFLGFRAGYSVTTGTGNIVIGYDKGTSAAGANNELNIGGVLYGKLDEKTIGISTRAPQAALDIVSTGTLASQYAQIWRDSTGLVVASMTATGKLYTAVPPIGDNLGNHAATKNLDMEGFDVVNVATITVSSITTTAAGVTFSTNVFVMKGSLGVGTGTPYAPLHVVGDIIATDGGISSYRNTGANASLSALSYGAAGTDFPMLVLGRGRGTYLSPTPIQSGNQVGQISFNGTFDVAGSMYPAGSITSVATQDFGAGPSGSASLNFSVMSNGAIVPVMAMASGNVAIGSGGTPYRLHVSSGAGESGIVMAVSTGATNMFWVAGDGAHAVKFFGDGSGLTGIGGNDNLGDHTATQDLHISGHDIDGVSTMTVTGYVNVTSSSGYYLNGYTVLRTNDGSNIFLGRDAGRVTSGTNNTFLGNGAGYTNAGAAGNTFVGWNSGYKNTGQSNTFLGMEAGYDNTSGYDNVFIGRAGVGNTVGVENFFAGNYAGQENTSGSYNTFLGAYAGYTTKTGYANTLIGNGAGGSASLQSFSSSTVLGTWAGQSLTTGSDNIFLGWMAGYNITTGTGNIILGYEKTAPAATSNNHLNIGGLIYGDLSSKVLGINRVSPQAALDIVSTGTLVSQYAQIWRNSAGTIVSSMTATGKLYTAVPPIGDNLGDHTATKSLNMGGNPVINVSSITIVAPDTIPAALWVSTSIAVPHLYVSTGGRVGIGKFAPAAALDIVNIARFTSSNAQIALGAGDKIGALEFYANAAADQALGAEIRAVADTPWSGGVTNYGGGLRFFTRESYSLGSFERMRISNTGNIGISTGAPQARLDVLAAGSAQTDMAQIWRDGAGVIVASVSATGVFKAQTVVAPGSNRRVLYNGNGAVAAAGSLYWDSASSWLGIGASPNSTLWIQTSETQPLKLANPSLGSGSSIGMVMTRSNTASDSVELAYVYNTIPASRAFRVRHMGGGGTLTMLDGGNVGISSAAPSYRLVVSSGAGESGNLVVISTGTSEMIKMTGAGEIYASKFIGDGSGLTGIAGGVPASIDVSTINATATTPYGGVNITTNTFVQGVLAIGTTTATAARLIVKNSGDGKPGLQLITTGAKPTCAAAYRGSVFYEQGGGGAADLLYICMKMSTDAYQWVLLGRGN